MRVLLLTCTVLVAACADGTRDAQQSSPQLVEFSPASSTASLNYFRGQTYIKLTEQDPSALGYSHVPRSIHIIAPLKQAPAGIFDLTDTAEANIKTSSAYSTLRVVEYGTLPRVFLVRSGTLTISEIQTGTRFGQLTIDLTTEVEDSEDGTVLLIEGHYTVPIDGMS